MLQTWILKRLAYPAPLAERSVYTGKSKLTALFGAEFLESLRGLSVLDYGCGQGLEVIEAARAGAELAMGIDIDESSIEICRERAAREMVQDRCRFAAAPEGQFDIIISLDSFDHYSNPEGELEKMYRLLKVGGLVAASWGPPWYHPYGSHLLELPPWSHLVFSESAIMEWRSCFRNDGATRFSEVKGGLNKMTISRFDRLIGNSRFRIESRDIIPIRGLTLLHNRITREFMTSVVTCRLRKAS